MNSLPTAEDPCLIAEVHGFEVFVGSPECGKVVKVRVQDDLVVGLPAAKARQLSEALVLAAEVSEMRFRISETKDS